MVISLEFSKSSSVRIVPFFSSTKEISFHSPIKSLFCGLFSSELQPTNRPRLIINKKENRYPFKKLEGGGNVNFHVISFYG